MTKPNLWLRLITEPGPDAYTFVARSATGNLVAFSAERIQVDWDRSTKEWVATEHDVTWDAETKAFVQVPDGETWVGRCADSHAGAVLALIADRIGLVAQVSSKPSEDDEEGTPE